MRCGILIVGLALGTAFTAALEAAPARILKVLPHYVDRAGRIAPSPSLFDRDAYQAVLRGNRALCSALRFDVQWKSKAARHTEFKLRIEMVTSAAGHERPITVEQAVRVGWLGRRWSRLPLEGRAFREAGDLIAWRVSLWDGSQLLAEQKSFLW